MCPSSIPFVLPIAHRIFSFRPVPNNSRPSGRRSQSDDSGNVAERPRSSGKSRKKKSQHADVIDTLDFTGVGPSMSSTLPLNFIYTHRVLAFHHDGPFDACAPSRNKHHNKAPLYAWGVSDASALRSGDGAYPSADAYNAFSNDYPEVPKKKVDAIAEAWGIHEPEPFEEFFAGGGSGRQDSDTPASSIYNGKDSHSTPRNNPPGRRVKDNRGDRPATSRRSFAPPPQPIFFADPSEIELPESPPSTTLGFPKRSKSLLHRIRKMRDAPNVPVGPDYDETPPSPSSPIDASSPRPTHRSQNSFLGRFGGTPRTNQLPVEKLEKPDSYVFIEPQTNKDNKELPVLPFSPDEDVPSQSYSENQMGATSSSPGDRFSRKTSIMKKVGRVVRGAK